MPVEEVLVLLNRSDNGIALTYGAPSCEPLPQNSRNGLCIIVDELHRIEISILVQSVAPKDLSDSDLQARICSPSFTLHLQTYTTKSLDYARSYALH